jgi:hypothetical protein
MVGINGEKDVGLIHGTGYGFQEIGNPEMVGIIGKEDTGISRTIALAPNKWFIHLRLM